MWTKNVCALFSVPMFAFLVGCGGSSPAAVAYLPSGGPPEPVSMEALIGTWVTPCYDVNGDGHYFARSRMVFDGTSASGLYAQWAGDKTCSGTPLLAQEWGDSAWTLGETTAAGTALDRNYSFNNVIIAQEYSRGVWNKSSGCGPFQLGVTRDISGQTCWGWALPEKNGTIYDTLFYRDGNLLVGDPKSGNRMTAQTRPKGLFRSAVYRRE